MRAAKAGPWLRVSEVKSKALLSILIPTFNRPAALQCLLSEFILPVLEFYSGSIEVLISDNSDRGVQDFNSKLVDQVNQQLKIGNGGDRIRYIRNESNVGYGRNLVQLFNESKGCYFWYFSDGDTPSLAGFHEVMKSICRMDADYYSVGFRVRSAFGLSGVQPALTAPADILFTENYFIPFMYLCGTIHRRNVKAISYDLRYENFQQIYIFLLNTNDWNSFKSLPTSVFIFDASEVRRFSLYDTYCAEINVVKLLATYFRGVGRVGINLMLISAFKKMMWDVIAINAGYLKTECKGAPRVKILINLASAISCKTVFLYSISIMPRVFQQLFFSFYICRANNISYFSALRGLKRAARSSPLEVSP